MENYIGKICPFCKTEITEADAVKVCPACNIPHHEGCWTENKGCTTFGCSEQHYEAQHTNPSDVCSKCGAPLGDGQAFCPKCGTPKNAPQKNICGKCGAELQDGQEFCPKCGQKAGLAVDAGVNSAINQFNAGVQKTNAKKKKTPLIIGIAVAVVAAVIAVVALGGGSKVDLNDVYEKYCDGEYWADVADDGTFLSIDDNPLDLDDYYNEDADDAIQAINKELGFSDSLWNKMCTTTSNDGRQTDSNDKVTVSWKYHPNRGLSVTYEIND